MPLSRFSSSGSTKNLIFVLVDVCPLMRLSLATCLTGRHQSLSLTVFSWVDVSITRASCCFESRSTLFIHACLRCSQPLPEAFQPLLSDHPLSDCPTFAVIPTFAVSLLSLVFLTPLREDVHVSLLIDKRMRMVLRGERMVAHDFSDTLFLLP